MRSHTVRIALTATFVTLFAVATLRTTPSPASVAALASMVLVVLAYWFPRSGRKR